MLSLILSSLIISTEPNQPTQIIGSGATPDGKRNEITITQPENYIQILNNTEEPTNQTQIQNATLAQSTTKTNTPKPILIDNQISITNPKDMNPLDYRDKIENTIYQLGDRLIIIQSIPLKYIKKTLTPNTQPTITNYPIL